MTDSVSGYGDICSETFVLGMEKKRYLKYVSKIRLSYTTGQRFASNTNFKKEKKKMTKSNIERSLNLTKSLKKIA